MNPNLSRIRGVATELESRKTAMPRREANRTGRILLKALDPPPRADDTERAPFFPFQAHMLGDVGHDGTRPFPEQTLHLPLVGRSDALRLLDKRVEAGDTHLAIALRSGLDGKHSFDLPGEYDYLLDPDGMEWLYREGYEARGLPLMPFKLEDDDRSFNRNTARVFKLWERWLRVWGPMPGIASVSTGIEVDETSGEQNNPSRVRPRTIAQETERVAFIKSIQPDLPVAIHQTADALVAVPGADVYWFQAHSKRHDGTWRNEGAFRHEFGPNVDNGKPRPGLWAKQGKHKLALMEIADQGMTRARLREMLRGAMAGAAESGIALASGMGNAA